MEDPDQVLPPNGILFLIALREDEPGECISFTLLEDEPLDLDHGSGIMTLVSESPGVRIAGPTHVFRSSIASKVDMLSPPNGSPFNLQ